MLPPNNFDRKLSVFCSLSGLTSYDYLFLWSGVRKIRGSRRDPSRRQWYNS